MWYQSAVKISKATAEQTSAAANHAGRGLCYSRDKLQRNRVFGGGPWNYAQFEDLVLYASGISINQQRTAGVVGDDADENDHSKE